MMNAQQLLDLRAHPHDAARAAVARRRSVHGNRILVRPTEPHPVVAVAARLGKDELDARASEGAFEALEHWPAASQWRTGDKYVLRVDPEQAEAFARYLAEELSGLQAEPLPADCAITCFSGTPSGLHALWSLAALRIALPPHVRVEVRHDLLGIALAQVALGWGPDTLCGPIEPDRVLPLAGVPRPSEATRAGLHNLVTLAGLVPVPVDASTPTPPTVIVA